MNRRQYDAIVLGAGHNGLVLQAYLARCGLSTLSIDRAAVMGGGLYTAEDNANPGFLHNTHSVFHRAITAMPWFKDLQLAEQGVRYVHPPLNMALILEDGRNFRWYLDVNRAAESLAEFSKRDANRLKEIHEEYAEMVQRVVGPLGMCPPIPEARRRELLCRSRTGRKFLEAAAMSPREFAEKNFESDVFRSVLMFFCIIREFDVNEPGHGYLIPSLIASTHKAELCVGGSYNLARGLASVIRSAGGEILEQAVPRRILLRNGQACGVQLADGSEFSASLVVSSLNPQQTFLELLEPSAIPPGLDKSLRNYRYQVVGPLFGVNVALREAPAYDAARQWPELSQAFVTILGLQSPDEIYQLYSGRYPSRMTLWGTTPTQFDPSQAPPGRHTAFQWQKVPYALDGDARNWDRRKQSLHREALDRWREFAPNMTQENILNSFATTPLDTERRFPNMAGGDLMVGWMGREQSFENRPVPGAGAYRTPIRGLYLCGSCAHPGGNITGLPGYNAARVIAEDLGLKRWWSVIDLEAEWSALE